MDVGGMPSPYLQQPITTKHTLTGKGKGAMADVSFALSSMQGWRASMEDAHAHTVPTKNTDKLAFFGVFDGHGGDQAAIFAAKFVLTFIEASEAYEKLDTSGAIDPDGVARALMEGFIDCDEDLREIPGFRDGIDYSGSTATTCFVTPTHYVIGNTGDSRTVLCKADKVGFATIDHKPDDPKETKRVKDAGGFITDERVNGDLASARSFGDFRYKQDPNLPPSRQQITVLPEVSIVPRSPDDQFMIIACDGVWDVMSNLECTRYVLTALKKGVSPANACEMVLDECLRKSSGDNMSIMIVTFSGCPRPKAKVAGKISSDLVREGMVDSLI